MRGEATTLQDTANPLGFLARVSILISGRGSNMEALVGAMQGAFPARPALVISDDATALGLEKAHKRGVDALALTPNAYADKRGFEKALLEKLQEAKTDILCLAGFMRIVSGAFLADFGRPVLNIHPSLLPAYKGLDTHKRALEAGERDAGCSVHIVTPELDSGPLLAQRRVPIRQGDSATSLARRVLKEECTLYPKALYDFIKNNAREIAKNHIPAHTAREDEHERWSYNDKKYG